MIQQFPCSTPRFIELRLRELKEQFHLTKREMQVVQWILEHKGVPEIKLILHISESTVKTHCTNIFNKMRIYSKTQIFEWFYFGKLRY